MGEVGFRVREQPVVCLLYTSLAAHDFGLTTSDQFYVMELTAVPASGVGTALTARVEMAQGLGWKLPMLLEGRCV